MIQNLISPPPDINNNNKSRLGGINITSKETNGKKYLQLKYKVLMSLIHKELLKIGEINHF